MHTDDMYLNRKSSNEMFDILNKNGFEIEAVIKHGFGDLGDHIYRKQKIES